MRVAVIAINAIVAVFFASFLAYMIFARSHLDGLARRFVTEKTLEYSQPVVDLAEKTLDSPIVRRLLTAQQLTTIRREIIAYRKDPLNYIADLTRHAKLGVKPEKPNPLLAKVAAIKAQIRKFYDETLEALIVDLRIFATSNLCAALIALGVACSSRGKTRSSLLGISVILCVAVVYCTYLYINDLTFFRILFQLHMGWTYPASLVVAFAFLYYDYLRASMALEEFQSGRPYPSVRPVPLKRN